MPARYQVFVLMAAWSGLRQGELLALTRADLDLDTAPARVRVRKAIRRTDTGRYPIDVPKTASSVREVSLPVPLAVALRKHLETFVPNQPGARVFTTSTGTTPARSNLGDTWHRACTAAGVPQVRLHDLRHVAQVFAAEAGATLPELMARLGHATPAAAMVYLHARADRDATLLSALAEAMAVPPPRPRWARRTALTTDPSYCHCTYMTVKDDRLQVRVDPAAKHALERAAAAAHLTLSAFVLQAAQARAKEVLAERPVIGLDPQAAAAFACALAEPGSVNTRLAAALSRPRKFDWLD